MSAPYFWQQAQWQKLQAAYLRQQFAHAWLLSGDFGLGLLDFARHLSQALLCQNHDLTLCQQCKSCQLFAAGNHPDFHELKPEVNARDGKLSRDIKVAEVRALIQSLQLHARQDGFKVALIHPAARLNINAANSLLKTLEEPSNNTVLILVNEGNERLLPTITSRCQNIHFSAPLLNQSIPWLQGQIDNPASAEALLRLNNGAPLAALAAQDWQALRLQLLNQLLAVAFKKQSPVASAASLNKEVGSFVELTQLLTMWQHWLHDIAKLQQQIDDIAHVDFQPQLTQLAANISPLALFAYYQKLLRHSGLSFHPLNQQQVLEELLLGWAALF